jgi:predicted DNA-binding helix-hairpin-helix protein
MSIYSSPDGFEKLALIGSANDFERAGDNPVAEGANIIVSDQRNIPLNIKGVMSCITEVATPKGAKPVLKAMVTTACEMDCYYCPFRAGRAKTRRVTFKPDELAAAFDQLQRARLVDGIFLSSGIIGGGVKTQDRIIDTIEIIRSKYAYEGYIHLKIMPGAEYDQLRRAMQLADRISINLEGANAQRLDKLAPKKDFEQDLLTRIRWAHEIREKARHEASGSIRAGVVTQFVVGAVGDTDIELLSMTDHLYSQVGLRRAYYSRFKPVTQTPFEELDEIPAIRERRLYEASFLLRDYAWDVEELSFEGEGNLRLDVDPKRAWADEHLREQPIDLMRAEKGDLLRVPGIGPKGAQSILKARRFGVLREISDLKKIGIAAADRAAPYVLFNGHRPVRQLSMFED